ncbi:MAG: TraR/DksA C4-type zinc finger protein [Candidatus Niyogibacteria bacterium]|nr:TraR/DksA C4-type zinc finger protein [Candidatus Niyogibacteria bacterium]
MISNLDFYKNKLEEELARLERELETVGRRNPENPDDWEPTEKDLNLQTSDQNEMADKFEEFDTRVGIETALEEQLNNVKKALKRIEEGNFGKCEICQKPIDEKRLKANPAASACLKHAS